MAATPCQSEPGSVTKRGLQGYWLGRRSYRPVHELQRRWQLARQEGTAEDVVLLLEHSPVITLGRGAHPEHVLAPPAELARRGVECVETGRGGDVTLHAPGQLVVYPILSLAPDRQDVRRYVGDLTEVMRRLALECGVSGGAVDHKLVGLWVDRSRPARWPGSEAALDLAKLGAIGVSLSRWVTMHGFALNLTTDLSLFGTIVPCGIRDHGVTSIEELTGHRPDVVRMASRAFALLAERLDSEAGALEDASRLSDDELATWPAVASPVEPGREPPPSAAGIPVSQ